MRLDGKRVLVMGLGLHGGGLGVTRWLAQQGARVTVTDLKKPEDLRATLEQLHDVEVEFVLGEHRDADFVNADLIVRNPGVPRESHYLQRARARGIPILMEMSLFFEQLPCGAEQVVGITGTKGKTTTTLMVGAILKKANAKTVVAGNLRVSALELLAQIDAATPVVLELSSFQLEGFAEMRVSPRFAAITNIYPDHLNRYRSMDDYAAAKAEIFRCQGSGDYCILNFDNSALTQLRPRVPSRVVWFSRQRALDDGAWVEGEWIVWNAHGAKTRVMPTAQLSALGEHNVENALAATAVACVWGAAPEVIAEVLREFKGAPHRLEVVRELDGVTFINDTTATAPTATLAALNALARRGGRIVLIAGGADKGLDYNAMARAIVARQARVVLLQGSATLKIERALDEAGGRDLIIGVYDKLDAALGEARGHAGRGDIVLLSPGCASFGMFVNEFDRGEQFRELVKGL